MRAEVHWIPGPWRGRLGVVTRPRGGDWLEEEVQGWRTAGVDLVVSLLTPDEVSELQLEEEERWCREEGVGFRSLPIPDRGVPSALEPLAELVGAIMQAVDSGESVAVHCRQGIGRSALVAASVMAAFGEEPAHALEKIASVRGRPVPDTKEQRDWVQHVGPDLLLACQDRRHGQPSAVRETPTRYGRARQVFGLAETAGDSDAAQQCDKAGTAGLDDENV